MAQPNYVVVEMQRSGGVTAILTDYFADQKQAEQKYHTVLSYAAVSGLDCHSCVMMVDTGDFLKKENYTNEPEPEGGEE